MRLITLAVLAVIAATTAASAQQYAGFSEEASKEVRAISYMILRNAECGASYQSFDSIRKAITLVAQTRNLSEDVVHDKAVDIAKTWASTMGPNPDLSIRQVLCARR